MAPFLRKSFPLLAVLLALGLLELLLRLGLAVRAALDMRAHHRLIPMEQLQPLDHHGFRNTRVYPESLWQVILSDVLRLRYVVHPGYRHLDSRFDYFTIRVNRDGFRGSEWSVEENPGEFRILLSGGSAAFSLYSPEEGSLHVALEQWLQRYGCTGLRFRVFCAGMPGATVVSERALLQDWIPAVRPHLVVEFGAFNDLIAGILQNPNTTWRRVRRWVYHPITKNVKLLYVPAHLFLTWAEQRRTVAARKGEKRKTATPEALARSYLRELQAMQQDLQAGGIAMLPVLQPSLLDMRPQYLTSGEQQVFRQWQATFPGQVEDYRRAAQALRQELIRLGLPCMDATVWLQEAVDSLRWRDPRRVHRHGAAAEDNRRSLFVDVVHLTPAANRILAAWIGEAVLQRVCRRARPDFRDD